MENTNPTAKDIVKLLSYLPKLHSENINPIVQLRGGETNKEGVMIMPWPQYHPLVEELFSAAAEPCWCYYHYDSQKADEMLRGTIEKANLAQIKTMLTRCVRGERFCSGFWSVMLAEGHIQRLLEPR